MALASILIMVPSLDEVSDDVIFFEASFLKDVNLKENHIIYPSLKETSRCH